MDSQTTSLEGTRATALKIGAGASVLAILIGLFTRAQFFQSYLLAYTYWLGLAGGGLFLLLISHLVVGKWWLVMQRPLEAAARTFPLLLLLFLPLLLGRHALYEWTHTQAAEQDPMLSQKLAYLNEPFFLLRAAVYFCIWIGMARLLTLWSRRQDETGDPALAIKMRRLSGIGLVVYVLATSFASFDWLMSLEPDWFSSIYGALFVICQGLSTLAFAVLVVRRLAQDDPMKGAAGPQQFHDIGNLMFAFVILWAYMSFGQFLIIWSGNLHEETFWYLDRRYGGWLVISWVLFLANFFIPFFLLLMKANKRRPDVLRKIALWILFTRFIDIHWQIAPTFHKGFHLHVLDVLLPVALGGFWIAAFLRQLAGAPVLPVKDPRFVELYGDPAEAGHGP